MAESPDFVMMFRNGLERWWRTSSVDAQSQQELREVYSPLFAHSVFYPGRFTFVGLFEVHLS